jgi:hypothetical protein
LPLPLQVSGFGDASSHGVSLRVLLHLVPFDFCSGPGSPALFSVPAAARYLLPAWCRQLVAAGSPLPAPTATHRYPLAAAGFLPTRRCYAAVCGFSFSLPDFAAYF